MSRRLLNARTPRARVFLVIAISLFVTSALGQSRGRGPTIVFGGDVLYEAPLVYQARHRARDVGRAQALSEILEDIAPTLREADLSVVNLEGPIGPRRRERVEGGPPVFRAPELWLDVLAGAGVDLFGLANNHSYDQGRAGLDHTLGALEARELAFAGAGETPEEAAAARIVERRGARLAIVALSEGSNHRPSSDEAPAPVIAFLHEGHLAESIARARGEADLVVAYLHWTADELGHPRPIQREIAREAAEAGADLVVGHGTHAPGRRETVETEDGRRVPILYSLGNLVAAMEAPHATLDAPGVGARDALLARVRTRWEGRRLAIEGLDLLPHWIARPLPFAPWLEGGRLPTTRVLSLERERERLARCGEACDRRRAEYARRRELLAAATRDVEAEAATALVAPARAGAPPAASRRRRLADDDPRLRPFLTRRSLGAHFPEGSAEEERIDDGAISAIVTLLRSDPSLRVEIVAHASPAEHAADPNLARRRARRVYGLIAMRGPSRSRFTSRGGPPGTPRVTARLNRRE